MKNDQLSLLSLLSYGIGVVVGLFLILIAAWGDMESSSYGFPRLANAGLDGLYCPILMTTHEIGKITLNVSNTTRNEISPSVKTQVSTSLLPEEFLENVQLAPGESKRLEWTVDSENIDLGYFIFAKVLLFSAYPLPSREATCGIFMINWPGTGQVIVPILVVLSLLSMAWGLHQMNRMRASNKWLTKYMGSLTFLAVVIVLGLILSFIGGWMPSVILLVVALLTAIILLSSVLLIDRTR